MPRKAKRQRANAEVKHGCHFRSGAEVKYADRLEVMLADGEIAGWAYEPQVFSLDVNGHRIARYTPDFIINHRDGTDEVVEVKGYWRADARLRVKLFQALYPRYLFTVVGTPMDKRLKK
jgi:hypothetical protein